MYIYMGASQKSGVDRSAVIRTMDQECLCKVPDPYPFVRCWYSYYLLLAITSPPATVAAKTVTTASRGSNKTKTAPAAVVAIEGEDAVAVEIAVEVTVVQVKSDNNNNKIIKW